MRAHIYFGRYGQACYTVVTSRGAVSFHCQGMLSNLSILE